MARRTTPKTAPKKPAKVAPKRTMMTASEIAYDRGHDCGRAEGEKRAAIRLEEATKAVAEREAAVAKREKALAWRLDDMEEAGGDPELDEREAAVTEREDRMRAAEEDRWPHNAESSAAVGDLAIEQKLNAFAVNWFAPRHLGVRTTWIAMTPAQLGAMVEQWATARLLRAHREAKARDGQVVPDTPDSVMAKAEEAVARADRARHEWSGDRGSPLKVTPTAEGDVQRIDSGSPASALMPHGIVFDRMGIDIWRWPILTTWKEAFITSLLRNLLSDVGPMPTRKDIVDNLDTRLLPVSDATANRSSRGIVGDAAPDGKVALGALMREYGITAT